MLTVAKVTSGTAAGYADYLEGKTQDQQLGDYYLKDGERVESPGRWAAGANVVGVDPELPVAGDQLRLLMAVRRPDTGAPLRKAGASGEAVAALDATFSAPKSVSAVWAIADAGLRAEIERAHELAIDRALDYAVVQVRMVRERINSGSVVHAKPEGLVATSWRHTTARAVDGRLPDPQLHSHVLLHGAVRRDARVVAIDSRSWLVHQREIGAAYRTELAAELNRLGFEIVRGTGRGGRYFELAGVPQELLDRWSSRHRQVQAAIEERLVARATALGTIVAGGGPEAPVAQKRLELLIRNRRLVPKEERSMATATRSAKTPITHRDLDEHWRRAAARHRLDTPSLARLRGADGPRLSAASDSELLAGLIEFDATFPARDARAVALERSAGAPIDAALEQLRRLRAADEILVLADGRGTTRAHRGRESTTVDAAERVCERIVAPIPAELVAMEADRLDRELSERGGGLSIEQRAAIELACSTRQVVLIEGQAGTGKTTTLTGIARAHRAAGRELILTSTAALAAERLAAELSDAGVETIAFSTVALQAAIDNGDVELGVQTTIIHDEAALASTREQQRLLAVVEESGARLIEVGDPRQNQPVGAGGLWQHLERVAEGAGARVELTRNQRAKDPFDRRDQALFRDGEHARAIRGYAARDRVHLASEQGSAEDRALDVAHTDRQAGLRTIVIAQTSNERLDELNARAQAIRHQHGELGHDSIRVPRRPYRLHAGDDIQVRRTIRHPDRGQLRNGTSAEISSLDSRAGALELELGDGTRLRLDEQQLAAADIRLAYVQHPFPAQGQTTDTAHVIIAEHTTAEGSYVALTRAREQTHLYAPRVPDAEDHVASLAERMSRTEPDLPSIATPLAHETTITNIPDRVGEPAAQPIAGNRLKVDRGVEHHDTSARQWPGLDRESGPTRLHIAEPEARRVVDFGWDP